MRIFGLERDNDTAPSEPDPHGNSYSVSFELYPFHEGATYSCYQGMLCGSGYRNGDFCVVKALKDKEGTVADWLNCRKRATEAQRLANAFNSHLGYRAISFDIPLLANLDTVSDFTWLYRLLRPHKKHLQPGECIIFEEFFEEGFQTFEIPSRRDREELPTSRGSSNPAGDTQGSRVERSDVRTAQPSDADLLLQAFAHFSWLETRQSSVVAAFQGIIDQLAEGRWDICLTNPTLHSQEREFGPEDGGLSAVWDVMAMHQCNRFCEVFRSAQPRNLPSDLFTGSCRG